MLCQEKRRSTRTEKAINSLFVYHPASRSLKSELGNSGQEPGWFHLPGSCKEKKADPWGFVVLKKGLQDYNSSLMILLLCSFSLYSFIQVVSFTPLRPDWWFQWFLHNNPWVLVLISKLDICLIFQVFPWLVPGSQSPYFAFFSKRTAFAICHINLVIDPSPFIPDYTVGNNDGVICSLKINFFFSVCFLWVSVRQCG